VGRGVVDSTSETNHERKLVGGLGEETRGEGAGIGQADDQRQFTIVSG